MARGSRSAAIDTWLARLLRSLIGVVIGAALIIAMVALLFWNESQALQTLRAADGALGVVSTENPAVTWTLRPLGMILLVVGFALLGGPFVAFANFARPLGAMLRFVTTIFALMLGLGLGTLIIALTWLFFRPWWALAILLAGAVVVAAIGYAGYRIADARQRESMPSTPTDA